jgi:hypothetical protein
MRIHMADPAWWEQYTRGTGNDLAVPGRTAFDRGIKGKLIMDLVGNSEHSFRLFLYKLDPANEASKFATICKHLFRATTPHLSRIPVIGNQL